MPNIVLPASSSGTERRRRYARSPGRLTALTPAKLEMLRWLAEMRFLSLPQIARLCCPNGRQDLSEKREDLSQKRARRHMRDLFDAGLVDVLPVSRAALAPAGVPNDASLLYGSAPNVYAPAAEGLKVLRRAGLIDGESPKRPPPAYGPRNGLFLAHELQVRDVRVWLEMAARRGGHHVECWRDGEEAVIQLDRERPPRQARPDAWFVYRLGGVALVGLVEVDRGTERGDRRWGEKVEAYAALFADRGPLRAATGYVNARVLVLTPDARRRDRLCGGVGEMGAQLGGEAGEQVASRFWFSERSSLDEPDLTAALWRRPGGPALLPLISP